MTNISEQWAKFIDQQFPRYKGIGLEVVHGGYRYRDKFFATLDEVDEYLKEAGIKLGESINRVKNEK